MTKGEIVSTLRGDLKEVSSDSYFTDRQLWSKFFIGGLMYMERERKNLHNLDIYTFQSFDTEKVNKYEGTCVPIECLSCRIKVPNLVSLKGGILYKSLTSPDGSIKFNITDPTSYQRKLNLKSGNQGFAFKEGEYIYLSKCLPCVKFGYVSNDMNHSTSCKALEEENPFPDYMIDTLIKNALNTFQIAIKKPQDISSNKTPNS